MLAHAGSEEIEYPTSDGLPMGETDTHRNQIMDLIHALEVHFMEAADVYVSGNLLMFYEKDDGRRHLSPDVLVTFGIPKRERDSYKIWEEGKAPDLIIEITSKSTRVEDMGLKKGLYAFVGVREYFIFDPLQEYLSPRLRGYRLEGEDYVPLVGEPLASQALNLDLRVVENHLRLVDRATEKLLPTRRETEEARRQAEDELRRLRAEVDRLRGSASDPG